ncbi:uncharacterized protein LOC122659346 [Telopea speciosissima]|uniref:uncharacterized protein LOC122659346 n=1 Tax=Telopea speciosissima TaxID=54955 RepID=UPI001CC7FADD|nr:uncharacterized protein LOC122659346 [Telopea speciosissima]
MSLPNSLLASIPVLSGNNYKRWVEDLEINLGLLDLDMALREPKPGDPTDVSTNAERVKMKKWMTVNWKCILVMKKSIPELLRDSVEVSQKAEKGDLTNQITSAVFNGAESVREHLLNMAYTANKSRDLGMPIEELLVHLALKSLPDVYVNIKSANAAQKDKWTMKELISICA